MPLIKRIGQSNVYTIMANQDMAFVKNFTPPDFQAKNFTPSISLNFNSFSDKNTKKCVKMEKLDQVNSANLLFEL